MSDDKIIFDDKGVHMSLDVWKEFSYRLATGDAKLTRLRGENKDHLDTIDLIMDQNDAMNGELLKLRPELAAAQERIRQLDSEREWEPVPVGEIFRLPSGEPDTGFHAVRGRVYHTFETADGQRGVIALPDNYRIYRRRPQEQHKPAEYEDRLARFTY